MAKATLVTVPSTSFEVNGFVGQKLIVEIGDTRTVFVSFKSDDLGPEELHKLRDQIAAAMGVHEGTKLVVLCLPLDGAFEIHELTT